MAGFPKQKDKIGEKAKRPKPGIPLENQRDEIIRLLKHYHGNLSRTADRIGTTRTGLRNYLNRDPELQALLAECRERFIDTLEECSWHRAAAGDTVMSLFLLKTIGKDRGYDQDSNRSQAQEIAKAAFEFVINKSKNPADNPPTANQ
jgi:hypothetical protein